MFRHNRDNHPIASRSNCANAVDTEMISYIEHAPYINSPTHTRTSMQAQTCAPIHAIVGKTSRAIATRNSSGFRGHRAFAFAVAAAVVVLARAICTVHMFA